MAFLPIFCAVLIQSSPSAFPPKTEKERKGLLALASIVDPGIREKRLETLLSKFRWSSLEWVKIVRTLPSPLLSFPNTGGGKIYSQQIKVYLGKEKSLGKREVLIYLPKIFQKEKKYPLLLAMHGSGGRALHQIQQWKGYADHHQFILIASTGKGTDSGYGFSVSERQAELSTLRFALLHFRINPNRIFIGGTSRGGHLSWDLGLRFPDRWAGLAPLIGGPRLTTRMGQNNLRLLDNLLDIPILDLQGLKDNPGLLWNLRYAFAYFQKKKAKNKQFLTFPLLGHSYDISKASWGPFFSSPPRNPHPKHIFFRCSNVAHSRSFWFKATKLDSKKVQDSVGVAISPSKWKQMTLEAKRNLFAKKALERTAKIDAEWKRVKGNPVFRIHSRGVLAFELLLPKELLPKHPKHRILVRWNSSRRRIQGIPDAKRFLLDWLKRLDIQTAPILLLKWH
jgi:hypothetical protein